MERIAFIIPYYGRFNDYFPLWLNSCSYNKDVADFYVVTDIDYRGIIPDNVKFIHLSWENLFNHIQSLYNFPIALESPYGLCDFKCAYGEIFANLCKNYSHWAYGDIDLIWGRWRDFLPNDWYKYDKLGEFGHLTIIRNSEEMNLLYRFKDVFRLAFTDKRNLFFDEKGFNLIATIQNKKIYSFKIADCNPRLKKLTPITPLNDRCSGVFMWKNGELHHLSIQKNKIMKEPIMYIHFLKRKMKVLKINDDIETLLIYDNIIKEVPVLELEKLLLLIKSSYKTKFYIEYWMKYLSINQIIKTCRAKFHPTSFKVKEIEYKIINNQ